MCPVEKAVPERPAARNPGCRPVPHVSSNLSRNKFCFEVLGPPLLMVPGTLSPGWTSIFSGCVDGNHCPQALARTIGLLPHIDQIMQPRRAPDASSVGIAPPMRSVQFGICLYIRVFGLPRQSLDLGCIDSKRDSLTGIRSGDRTVQPSLTASGAVAQWGHRSSGLGRHASGPEVIQAEKNA